MSILAEPRRKQRISVDPRNLQWKNQEDKMGKKMMEKMGWKEGNGLGRNQQGASEHIKLTANRNQKGLGAASSSGDSTWIIAHDDFADILATLNKNKKSEEGTEEQKKEAATKMGIELTSRSVRRRIQVLRNSLVMELKRKELVNPGYQKFTKAKDLTQYTEKEKAAIFGGRKGKQQQEDDPRLQTENEETIENEVEKTLEGNVQLTTSTQSVAEYFAAKMAAIAARRDKSNAEGGGEDNNASHINITTQSLPKKEKKAARKEKEAREAINEEIAEESREVEDTEKERKKDKKRRRREAAEKEIQDEEEVAPSRKEKGRKKRRRKEEEED